MVLWCGRRYLIRCIACGRGSDETQYLFFEGQEEPHPAQQGLALKTATQPGGRRTRVQAPLGTPLLGHRCVKQKGSC